jgi:hypothetical protein
MIKNALRNGFVLSVVGAVLVGSVIGWLLFGSSGSKTASKSSGKSLQVSLRRGIYPPLGLALEQPTSWLTTQPSGLLRLSSPDAGATSVVIAAADVAGKANSLRPQINSQLVKTFKPAKVIGRTHGPIGKTPAISTAILGTSTAKRKVLIISTAVSSAYRTYSIQVFFTKPTPTRQSVLEVRNMLASIRFFSPTTG